MSTEDSLRELFEALEELRKEWCGQNRIEDYSRVRRVVEAFEVYGLETAKEMCRPYTVEKEVSRKVIRITQKEAIGMFKSYVGRIIQVDESL